MLRSGFYSDSSILLQGLSMKTIPSISRHTVVCTSLAWPDPFRAAAYRFEIISAALQGSGTVHVLKKIYNPQWLGV